jgi:hypothetical protein
MLETRAGRALNHRSASDRGSPEQRAHFLAPRLTWLVGGLVRQPAYSSSEALGKVAREGIEIVNEIIVRVVHDRAPAR